MIPSPLLPDGTSPPASARTFFLPPAVADRISHAALGRQMVRAWRNDGLFEVSLASGEPGCIRDKLLALVALGLGLSIDALARLALTHQELLVLAHDTRARVPPETLRVLPGDTLRLMIHAAKLDPFSAGLRSA